MNNSRRNFLQFLGRSSILLGSTPFLLSNASCTSANASPKPFPFKGMSHSLADELKLADGLTYDVLISWEIQSHQRYIWF